MKYVGWKTAESILNASSAKFTHKGAESVEQFNQISKTKRNTWFDFEIYSKIRKIPGLPTSQWTMKLQQNWSKDEETIPKEIEICNEENENSSSKIHINSTNFYN